jgi:hypothetical protein
MRCLTQPVIPPDADFQYSAGLLTDFVEKKYRGLGYGIKGLAMFLDGYASEEAVCCHPCPTLDLEDKYTEEKGKKIMKKYWSKVGLENYAKDQNILWIENWSMPEWIGRQLFTQDQ